MDIKLEYSFDDEPVSKFCYDLDNKKIEVHFKGYYDLIRDIYIENPCIWFLENWKSAKSKIGDNQKLYALDKHIGIFNLVLHMEYNNSKELEIHVLTVNNKYLILFFRDPKLSLE